MDVLNKDIILVIAGYLIHLEVYNLAFTSKYWYGLLTPYLNKDRDAELHSMVSRINNFKVEEYVVLKVNSSLIDGLYFLFEDSSHEIGCIDLEDLRVTVELTDKCHIIEAMEGCWRATTIVKDIEATITKLFMLGVRIDY